MAHFAELDENNIVIRVIRVDDAHEADGENWCHKFAGGRWKQTSYNNNIRYNYAGIGYVYDADADAFYKQQPFPSWSLEEANIWQPPISYPTDGEEHLWDEDNLTWTVIEG